MNLDLILHSALGLVLVFSSMATAVPIRRATDQLAALNQCFQLLQVKLGNVTMDTQYTTELYSLKARGLLHIDNTNEPLRIVNWDERESVNARLCLDRDEISTTTRRLYDNYITIRTPTDSNGNARYVGVQTISNNSQANLTLENSLGTRKNTYWNLVEQGKTGVQLFHNETTSVPYYLAVGKGGTIHLTRDIPDKSDTKFLFKRCEALVLKLAGGTNITYSPCFWTGPQLMTQDMQNYHNCLTRAMKT